MRPFALSMGDPAGIGPEITVKAWETLRAYPGLAFAVIAPPAIFADIPHKIIERMSEASTVFGDALPIIPIDGHIGAAGHPSSDNAKAVITSIETGVDLCLSGKADGIVTNPIAKHVLYEAGFRFPGNRLWREKSATRPDGFKSTCG